MNRYEDTFVTCEELWQCADALQSYADALDRGIQEGNFVADGAAAVMAYVVGLRRQAARFTSIGVRGGATVH